MSSISNSPLTQDNEIKVWGHDQQRERLHGMLERSSLPHALLFSGPLGVGKKTVARQLASTILGSKDSNLTKLLADGSHPDLHPLRIEEGKKEITVEGVRKLCSAMQLSPYYGHGAVAIIDNAHLMNPAASNALLTTLEEPTNNSYLILVTDKPQRLLETIVSRCQTVHFGELTKADIKEVLAKLLQKTTEDNAVETLAGFCGGDLSALSLDSFLDQNTLTPNSAEEIHDHCNTVIKEAKRISKLVSSAFQNPDHSEAFAISLATELGAAKELQALVWRTIHAEMRKVMRATDNGDVSKWANVLLSALEAERLTKERSLNAQLQLSKVLLEANA